MKIVLGSASARRLEIMRAIAPHGIEVEALPTGLDEKAIPRPPSPASITLKLALRKLMALQQLVHEPALLVAADTVVVHRGIIREKPTDEAQAREWLYSYNFHPAQVVTSVALFNTKNGHDESFVDSATVWFRDLTKDDIEEIVHEGSVLDCAGAFMIEHPLIKPHVARVLGDPCTVQGMPSEIMKVALRNTAY